MIILFGFRRKALRMGVIFTMCASCHTPAAHALTRVRKYFTLFFIPVIPLGDTYTTTCTMCGYGTRITKEAANEYLATIQQQQAAVVGTPDIEAGASVPPVAGPAEQPAVEGGSATVSEPVDPSSNP